MFPPSLKIKLQTELFLRNLQSIVGVTDCDIRQIKISQTVDNDQQLQTEN
jgi:hypothetical protein